MSSQKLLNHHEIIMIDILFLDQTLQHFIILFNILDWKTRLLAICLEIMGLESSKLYV